jgi:hypothetical protein
MDDFTSKYTREILPALVITITLAVILTYKTHTHTKVFADVRQQKRVGANG